MTDKPKGALPQWYTDLGELAHGDAVLLACAEYGMTAAEALRHQTAAKAGVLETAKKLAERSAPSFIIVDEATAEAAELLDTFIDGTAKQKDIVRAERWLERHRALVAKVEG